MTAASDEQLVLLRSTTGGAGRVLTEAEEGAQTGANVTERAIVVFAQRLLTNSVLFDVSAHSDAAELQH